MTHIMRIDEQNLNMLNYYSIMTWIDYDVILKELHERVDNDEGYDFFAHNFANNGESYTLSDFLKLCKEATEKFGIEISFDVELNNYDPNCVLYINNVNVGVFIITNKRDVKDVLHSALNTGDMGNVKVK